MTAKRLRGTYNYFSGWQIALSYLRGRCRTKRLLSIEPLTKFKPRPARFNQWLSSFRARKFFQAGEEWHERR